MPQLYPKVIHYDPPALEESRAPIPLPTPQKQCWYCKECLDVRIQVDEPENCRRCQRPSWEILPQGVWNDVEKFKAWWRKIYREKRKKNGLAQRFSSGKKRYFTPLQDASAEALACRAHEVIPDLSLAAIREMVATTDADLIRLALKTILERRNIRSRAGFFVTFIRSEKKFGKNWVHPK